ncbi:MAG: NAD(P)H-dependent oxidoreductase [Prevotella sp.]|nr:NAD(P)H-dependent oxidoreductase [Prevotella sp.]
MKKILFIIGSLRKESFNREVSDMVKNLLQDKAEVTELNYGPRGIVRGGRMPLPNQRT